MQNLLIKIRTNLPLIQQLVPQNKLMAFFYIVLYSTEIDTTPILQLWEHFKKDFAGWTANTWALNNVNIV